MAWDTPTLATVGQVLTAAFWNAEVKGNMDYLKGAITSYTPQVDQGVTNIGKTVSEGRYSRSGDYVDYSFNLVITGSGTSGQQIVVSLPVTHTGAVSFSIIGHGLIFDSSTPIIYTVEWAINSATSIIAYTDVANNQPVGGSPAFGLASSDAVRGVCRYFAA